MSLSFIKFSNILMSGVEMRNIDRINISLGNTGNCHSGLHALLKYSSQRPPKQPMIPFTTASLKVHGAKLGTCINRRCSQVQGGKGNQYISNIPKADLQRRFDAVRQACETQGCSQLCAGHCTHIFILKQPT
eukprot:1451307-Amphidinium_carterae.1